MKGEALATKYRPKNFKEVLGQDGLVSELKGLIRTQAYRYTNSIIIAGASGGGKAQPLTSKYLTPDRGYVELGKVKVGDLLYGELGNIYHVQGVYPQGKKYNYTITFDDGTTANCSRDHLWTYYKKYPLRENTTTLKELRKIYKTEDIFIQANESLDISTKELEITSKLVKKIHDKKKISEKYIRVSGESRLNLLRALFSLGGRCEDNKLIYKDKDLMKDFTYLARTLGYVAIELNDKEVQVIMKSNKPAIFKDFKISNKYKQDLVDSFNGTKIVDIKRGKKCEMVCIKTSNPTSLYITDNFKVTHNTTIARIFAKAINCEHNKEDKKPCNKCESCKNIDKNNYPDYLELDATSYRGVKEIEPLKALASQYPNKKDGVRLIYLDEAHTLSNQAWDVLLKLLEEGRNSTIFLFATTQLHSIRPAIVNRSQVFKVKPVTRETTVKELQRIANKEGITVERSLLENIARVYKKGLRDAIAGLDTLYKTKGSDLSKVKIDQVESVEDKLLKIMTSIKGVSLVEAIIELELLEVDPKEFNSLLSNILIALYLSESEKSKEEIVNFGVNPKNLKVFRETFKDIETLISLTASYSFDNRDQVKLYFILLDNLIREQDKEEEKELVEELQKEPLLRRGLKVKATKTKEKKSKKKKSKVKDKKDRIGLENFKEI